MCNSRRGGAIGSMVGRRFLRVGRITLNVLPARCAISIEGSVNDLYSNCAGAIRDRSSLDVCVDGHGVS